MNVENPPMGTEKELSAYLVRMFNLADSIFGNIGKLPVRKLLAPKPVVGKLYYYAHEIIVDGDIIIRREGLYVYASDGYRFIV